MSHSIDEPYSVYRRNRVKARKAHTCCACKEDIRPGHRYIRVFVLFDGRPETYKRCLRCEAMFCALVAVLQDREEWPDEDLSCGHEWVENGNGELPEAVARLAFLTADEIQALPAAKALPIMSGDGYA